MIRPVAADGTVDAGGVFRPVLRPRVIERIASAASQRIALIIAPAGYGKSVALQQYLDQAAEPTVRYDVTVEHASLLGFVRGFCDAVKLVAPDARRTLAGAFESNRRSVSPGADLAMWMHAHLKSFSGVIAIDDFHITENDAEICRFVVSLIERTSTRIRWIIASRSTTNLPVGSWLAYGKMDLTVDEHDLRFSLDEAKVAAKATRLTVREDELEKLVTLTAGWATALSFAFRSSTRSIDLRSISATTRELVYQYLAEQVYRSLNKEERSLLHLASYLDVISVEALRHAGYKKARSSIDSIRQRVAFIYQERPGSYKCHDLFKDFLHHQLELEGDELVAATKLKAAGALEKAGRIAAALVAYAGIGAWKDCLRVLQEAGLKLVEDGHGDAVSAGLNALPSDVRATEPVILGLRAIMEGELGRFDRAEPLFLRAISMSDSGELRAQLSIRLSLVLINQMRDPTSTLKVFDLEQLAPNLAAEIAALLAISHAYAGRTEQALDSISMARALLSLVDDNRCRAKVLQRVGVAGLRLGLPVDEVTHMQDRAAALAVDEGMFALAGRAFVALASIALSYEDDPAKEVWFAQQAVNAASKAGDLLNLQTALLQLISVEGRRGNVERVKALEQQIAPINTSDAKRMSYIIPLRAYMAAWESRFDDAHRLMATVIGNERFFAYDRAVNAASDALFLLALGQREAAISSIRVALSEVDAANTALLYARRQTEIAKLLCALAETIAGRYTFAKRLLRRDLSMGDLVVAAIRQTVVALCQSLQSSSAPADIQAELDTLDRLGQGGLARLLARVLEKCTAEKNEQRSLLTPAEMEILSALAHGRRPKDIAHESGRSVYTVQAHVQNIMKKLGCSGRVEVLRVARARGLIA